MAHASNVRFANYRNAILWLGGLSLLGIPAWLAIWRISHREALEAIDPIVLAGYALMVTAPPAFLVAVRLVKKELLQAGWEFWVVSFCSALAPCLLVGLLITQESAKRLAPISFGFIIAALAAGFVSWAVNSAIQRRAERARRRSKSRKRKGK